MVRGMVAASAKLLLTIKEVKQDFCKSGDDKNHPQRFSVLSTRAEIWEAISAAAAEGEDVASVVTKYLEVLTKIGIEGCRLMPLPDLDSFDPLAVVKAASEEHCTQETVEEIDAVNRKLTAKFNILKQLYSATSAAVDELKKAKVLHERALQREEVKKQKLADREKTKADKKRLQRPKQHQKVVRAVGLREHLAVRPLLSQASPAWMSILSASRSRK